MKCEVMLQQTRLKASGSLVCNKLIISVIWVCCILNFSVNSGVGVCAERVCGLTGISAVWLFLGAFIKHVWVSCGVTLSPSCGDNGKLTECSRLQLAEIPVLLKSRHLIGR